MNGRATAERMLPEGYASGEYNIVLDASLPGKYDDDPEELEIAQRYRST